MEQVRSVYNFLSDRGFPTTKTVWAVPPAERCGLPPLPDSTLRGITLQDEEYAAYCDALFAKGFEICLHGASAGNNRREVQAQALDLMRHRYGNPSTYICHSKNADNLYWEEQVTRLQPFRMLLQRMSHHRTLGAVEDSPYFWGDLCREHVKYIRLLRTRATDTLSANPSMPYYDPSRPYVKYWFSATKRALKDCATPEALRSLRENHGLTVLYQYLHRYAYPETLELNPDFAASVERILQSGDILVAPVGRMMDRLRLMQGVFLLTHGERNWLLNIKDEDVTHVQLATLAASSSTLVLESVPAGHMIEIELPRDWRPTGRNVIELQSDLTAVHRSKAGTLTVNCSDTERRAADRSIGSQAGTLQPMSWHYTSHTGAAHRPLSVLSRKEEFSMLAAQSWIILREILLRRRHMNPEKHLGEEEIALENHDNW